MRSPPSRRRGSKQYIHSSTYVLIKVASITEAWIETLSSPAVLRPITVASITEAWIETSIGAKPPSIRTCRLHHGGVDRNLHTTLITDHVTRVASITEAWIETTRRFQCTDPPRVASITEAWIETLPSDQTTAGPLSPPSRRRGSKQLA